MVDGKNVEVIISVIMITYGHEKYIIEAIEGVLKQTCNFNIELIIANDNSPDNTDDVIKDYLSEITIPSNFHVNYSKHNVNKGMINNFNWAAECARGKYIAICEGDDYWTDSLKLQTQVDFLEANVEYVLCFTNRAVLKDKVIEESKLVFSKNSFNKSEIPFIHVPTLTAVFRNVFSNIPTQMNNNIIDASLFLFLSQYGNFHYIDEKMAVYRVQDGGAWSGSTELVNSTRSVNVRLAAWKYFPDIDKISLANVLIKWIRVKKKEERKVGKYAAALKSGFLEYYFSFYIYKNKV